MAAVVTLAVVGATIACFAPAIFGPRQFGYRDAGHFYYPLYQRVEQEWNAGRVPLWDPNENAGMPLLGNPTAAVLYPGKLIYRVLPYPLAAKWYIIGHIVLAAGLMYGVLRAWGCSQAGSGIGAVSYAFGSPVLFQYCNIIFLVGAAWAPLGLYGADRWLTRGRLGGLLILAVVLALQSLGGDPQSAYILGLSSVGYAAALAIRERAQRPFRFPWLGGAIVILAWSAAILLIALLVPVWYRSQGWVPTEGPGAKLPPPSHELLKTIFPNRPGYTWIFAPRMVRWVAMLGWGLVAFVVVKRARAGGASRRFTKAAAGLGAAAILAGLLMAAQLLPVLEFAGLTMRASNDATLDVYPFSVEPVRLLELAWPKVLGTTLPVHRSILPHLTPHHQPKVWLPLTYIGAATLIFGFAAWGLREAEPRRAWLTAIAGFSVALALGQFASPLWAVRAFPQARAMFGPFDPPDLGEMRTDGYLLDALGSPYWVAVHVLPGFRTFRYPAKFLGFAALALSGLAAMGWDRIVAGRARRAVVAGGAFGVLSLLLAAAMWLGRSTVIRALATHRQAAQPTPFGPFDAAGAWEDITGAFLHGAVLAAAVVIVVRLASRRPALAGAMAVGLVTIDLAWVGQSLVTTVPQSLFEGTPEVLARIQEHEKRDPAGGPYRIHRMPVWSPEIWNDRASAQRVADFVSWERKTIQPKYGIPWGVEYTLTEGTAELFDYLFFFSPFRGNHGPELGSRLGLPPGEQLVYYPRRGFDLWNSRYFVLPSIPRNDEYRGIISFLPDTEPVYPRPDVSGSAAWAKSEDWRILKNKLAYDRAWIVHEARWVEPVRGMNRADRQPIVEEMLYQADPFWSSPSRHVFDPLVVAWVETDRPEDLRRFAVGGSPTAAERVRFVSYEPQRVEIEATLERPGLVVLADVHYPGWTLTIDGAPTTIHRVNRIMRGAAVESGTHRLVYEYRPRSFTVGLGLSGVGVMALLVTAAYARRRDHGRPTLKEPGAP